MSKVVLYPTIFIAAIVVLAAVRFALDGKPDNPTPPSTQATTQPATAPSTQETVADAPTPIVDMLGLVRASNPNYPTTQPLDLPVDLDDAAKLIIKEPVHLDLFGRLWITHPAGKPIADLLRKPLKGRVMFVQEQVLFVNYARDAAKPTIYVRQGRGVTRIGARDTDSRPDGADWAWDRATVLGPDVYVPFKSSFVQLIDGKLEHASPLPLVVPDGRTPETDCILWNTGDAILAWCPSENGKRGSDHVAVIRNPKPGERTNTTAGIWGSSVMQLIPLADGNVLAINQAQNGVELKLDSLDPPPPLDQATIDRVRELVKKLADRDPRVREQTQLDLEAMGPTIYPELEALRPQQRAEGQVRIEAILGQKFAPKLAGLLPLEGVVQVVTRFNDGGAVILLTGGGMYSEDGDDKTLIPAWVSIRPGRYVERMPEGLTNNFVPGQYHLYAHGSEWVVDDPVLGPRRWLGSRLKTLLPKEYRNYDKLIGIDQQGRWLFRQSSDDGTTLIIDPFLPDPTPRLPVWIVAEESAGWTTTGWPAVKRNKRVTVLGEAGWRVLDEKTEKFETAPPNVLPTVATDSRERRFELRNGSIRLTTPQGAESTIPLASADATMIFSAFDRLFVVAPGAVTRLNPDQPDSVDGTFTENLPTAPRRVWLDPAGRIIFADETRLWVTFPQGHIPRAIANLMLASPEVEEKP